MLRCSQVANSVIKLAESHERVRWHTQGQHWGSRIRSTPWGAILATVLETWQERLTMKPWTDMRG